MYNKAHDNYLMKEILGDWRKKSSLNSTSIHTSFCVKRKCHLLLNLLGYKLPIGLMGIRIFYFPIIELEYPGEFI